MGVDEGEKKVDSWNVLYKLGRCFDMPLFTQPEFLPFHFSYLFFFETRNHAQLWMCL
jgi:hypothetical protein